MSHRYSLVALLCTGLLFGAVPSVLAQDCVHRDDMGYSLLNEGGKFLHNVFSLLPGQGITNIPDIFVGPYETWDINDDGIPDSDQFELLTELLCLPDDVEHPLLDIAGIKDAYDANLATYWDLVYLVFDNEQAIVNLAPRVKMVGSQLRAAVGPSAANMRNVELDPCVFKECTTPTIWNGKTYGELADTLYNLGVDVDYLISKGFYGTNPSTLRTALDNASTAAFMAAGLGLDDTLLSTFFKVNRFDALETGLALAHLDWDFLNDMFGGYGIDTEFASEFGDDFYSLGLPINILPDPDEEIEYYEWSDVFNNEDYMLSGDIEDLIASVMGDLAPFSVPVRVVHASPDLDAIAICQDDALFTDNVVFRDITPYETANAYHPDFLYNFGLAMAGSDCSSTLLSNSYDLDNTSTLVVLNTAVNAELFMVNDILDMPRNGRARIRFINASPDAGPLTLTGRLGDGEEAELFANLNFKRVSAYKDVDPGLYELSFVSPMKGDAVLPSETMELHGGSVYTFFAMGFAADMDMQVNQDAAAGTVTLTVDPERTQFFAGESVKLEVEHSEELSPQIYFWYKDGMPVNQVLGPVLELPGISQEDAGNYSVYVVASAEGVLGSIQITALAPTIEVYESSVSITGRRTIATGDDLNLTANVAGNVTVVGYHWTWDDGTMPGIDTTGRKLVIEEVDAEQSGYYRVEVEVALPGSPENTTVISAQVYVRIDLVPMPAAAPAGLLLLALAMVVLAIVYTRSRDVLSDFEK